MQESSLAVTQQSVDTSVVTMEESWLLAGLSPTVSFLISCTK